MSQSMTFAPAWAKAVAIPSPMPDAAPVTNAVLPASSFTCVLPVQADTLAPKRQVCPRTAYDRTFARLGSVPDVRFSNRPFGVKHFQTIHQCGVDVARGLLLLFGIGTWALPPWDPRTRRNNLLDDLAVSVTAGPSGHTNSPHPSSRKGHLSTARWSSKFSPIGFDPERFSCCCRGLLPGPPELGAVNPDAVHDHGQPASQSHDRLL